MGDLPQYQTGAGFETAIDLGVLETGASREIEVSVGGVGQKNTIFFTFEINLDLQIFFQKLFVDRYSEVSGYFSLADFDRTEIPVDEEVGIPQTGKGDGVLPAGKYYLLVGSSETKLPTTIRFLIEVSGGNPNWPPVLALASSGVSSAVWNLRASELWVDGDLQISLDGVDWQSGELSKILVRTGTQYFVRVDPAVGLTRDSGQSITGRIYSTTSQLSFFYSYAADPVPDPNPSAFSSVNNISRTAYATSSSAFSPSSFNIPVNVWLGFYEISSNGTVWTPVSPVSPDDVQVRIGGSDWISIGSIRSPIPSVAAGILDPIEIRHIQKSDFRAFTRSVINIGRANSFTSYSFVSQTTAPMEVPAGTVIYWANPSTIPERWLVMDGRSFSLSQYPMLQSLYPSGVLPNLLGSHFFWDNSLPLGTMGESTGGSANVSASALSSTVGASDLLLSSSGVNTSLPSGSHSHSVTSPSISLQDFSAPQILHDTNATSGTFLGHVLANDTFPGGKVTPFEWGELIPANHAHGLSGLNFSSISNHSHLVQISAGVTHSHGQTQSVSRLVGVNNNQQTVLRSFGLIPLVYGGVIS